MTKDWRLLAFPLLTPDEAQRCADMLPEPDQLDLKRIAELAEKGEPLDAQWFKRIACVMSILAKGYLADPRQRENNRAKWLLWNLCDGDIFREGVVAEMAHKLDNEPRLCEEFGFNLGQGTKAREKRKRKVHDRVQDIRRAVRNEQRPYSLMPEDEAKLDGTWIPRGTYRSLAVSAAHRNK